MTAPVSEPENIAAAVKALAGANRLDEARERWSVPMIDSANGDREVTDIMPARGPSPEDTVLLEERRRKLADALGALPERQRTIFMLSHYEGHSSKEVSAMTGLNESTVRVHLFRAVRKLRGMLSPKVEDQRPKTDKTKDGRRNAIG